MGQYQPQICDSFLKNLFEDGVDEKNQIALWFHPSKQTVFCKTIEDAKESLSGKAESENCYFGLGLINSEKIPEIKKRKGRGNANEISKLTCVWLDVDYGNQHKKKVPPDQFEAMKVVEKMGLKPSIVVNSGNGLHVYWIFTEPQKVDDVLSLPKRWNNTALMVAKSLGYEIDSVHDFSRVFRVPGTLNMKTDPPKPVTILADNPERYEPDDIDQLCMAEKYIEEQSMVKVEAIAMNKTAQPPQAKLAALLANNSDFKRTWNHNRKDMSDTSPSGYDFSLAKFASAAGWTDQEIADLIIAFRTKHDLEPEKPLKRRKYLTSTIGRARSEFNSDKASGRIVELVSELPEDSSEITPDRRETIIENVSDFLSVPVSRWLKYGVDEGEYHLVLENGKKIVVGPVCNVRKFSTFSNKIYDQCGIIVKPAKRDQWDHICALLAAICEIITEDGDTRTDELNEWVESHCDTDAIYYHGKEGWEHALTNNSPIMKDGVVHVNLNSLKRHIHRGLGDSSITHDKVRSNLRYAGWKKTMISHKRNGKLTQRRYWCQHSK